MTQHGIGYWYVELEKQGFWRGSPHTWINRYVMSGSDPSAADASTVIGVLHGIENTIHPATANGVGVGFVEARAYGAAGGPPLVMVPYNTSLGAGTATGFTGGTGSLANIVWAPTLETCLGVHTRLNGLTSNGKPKYCRKFFRGINVPPLEDDAAGVIPPAVVTAVNALVLPWTTGMGPNNWVVIGTSGAQSAAAPVCLSYLTNRQVPKGRKKKKTSSSDVLSALSSAAGDVAHAITIAGAL